MPDPRSFLKAFGLVKGQRLGEFTVSTVTSSHVVIETYRTYQYGIELCLTYDGKGGKGIDFITLAMVTLQKHFANSKKPMIVLSGYGNPYDCVVDAPSRSRMHEDKDIVGRVIVHLTGHAQRVFTNTVITPPQQKAGRQKKRVADGEEQKKAEPAAKKQPIEVVSSVAANTRSKSSKANA